MTSFSAILKVVRMEYLFWELVKETTIVIFPLHCQDKLTILGAVKHFKQQYNLL